MGTVVVTRNFQLTLSKDVREEADIKIGERIKEVVDEGRIILEKIKKSPVDSAAGIWKGKVKDSVEYVNNLRKDWRG